MSCPERVRSRESWPRAPAVQASPTRPRASRRTRHGQRPERGYAGGCGPSPGSRRGRPEQRHSGTQRHVCRLPLAACRPRACRSRAACRNGLAAYHAAPVFLPRNAGCGQGRRARGRVAQRAACRTAARVVTRHLPLTVPLTAGLLPHGVPLAGCGLPFVPLLSRAVQRAVPGREGSRNRAVRGRGSRSYGRWTPANSETRTRPTRGRRCTPRDAADAETRDTPATKQRDAETACRAPAGRQRDAASSRTRDTPRRRRDASRGQGRGTCPRLL